MLLVRGKLESDEESARLVATELLPIAALQGADDARGGDPPDGADRTAGRSFEALAELLSRHRGDRRVSLELDVPAARRRRCASAPTSPQRVRPSEQLVAEVEQLCGAGSVELR